MAAPFRVFAKAVLINLTAEQLQALDRHAALYGTNRSQVVRAALDAYLSQTAKPERRRRS